LGREAAELGFSPIVAVGEEARALAEGAAAAGGEAIWRATAADAAAAAEETLAPGDVVLVKGSRGVGLDLVVESLMGVGDGSDKAVRGDGEVAR
jgi:UDP-N-acetylmuramoyl-tripeptide--D-alanyl-D-alanine ligase